MLRKSTKFMNKRSVVAAAVSPSQPSKTSVKIKGHIGQCIPENRIINLLKPKDIRICRTAALTSRRYILNIYSTNIHTEYFKHAA